MTSFTTKLWNCPQFPTCLQWSKLNDLIIIASEALYLLSPTLDRGELLRSRSLEIKFGATKSSKKEDSTANTLPVSNVATSDLLHWLNKSATVAVDKRVEFSQAAWCSDLLVVVLTNGNALLLAVKDNSHIATHRFANDSELYITLNGFAVVTDLSMNFNEWRYTCNNHSAFSNGNSIVSTTNGIFGNNFCGNSINLISILPSERFSGSDNSSSSSSSRGTKTQQQSMIALAIASGCMISFWNVPLSAEVRGGDEVVAATCIQQYFTCSCSECHTYNASNRRDINRCCYEHHVVSMLTLLEGDLQCLVYSTATGVFGKIALANNAIQSVWTKSISASSVQQAASEVLQCDPQMNIVIVGCGASLIIFGITDTVDTSLDLLTNSIRLQLDLRAHFIERLQYVEEADTTIKTCLYLVRSIDGGDCVLSVTNSATLERQQKSHCRIRGRLGPSYVSAELLNNNNIHNSPSNVDSSSGTSSSSALSSKLLLSSRLDQLRILQASVFVVPGSIGSSRAEQLSSEQQKAHAELRLELPRYTLAHSQQQQCVYKPLSSKWILSDTEIYSFLQRILDCSFADSHLQAEVGLSSVSICFLLSVEQVLEYADCPIPPTAITATSTAAACATNTSKEPNDADMVSVATSALQDSTDLNIPVSTSSKRKRESSSFMGRMQSVLVEGTNEYGWRGVSDGISNITKAAAALVAQLDLTDICGRYRHLLVLRCLLQLLVVPYPFLLHKIRSSILVVGDPPQSLGEFTELLEAVKVSIQVDVVTVSVERYITAGIYQTNTVAWGSFLRMVNYLLWAGNGITTSAWTSNACNASDLLARATAIATRNGAAVDASNRVGLELEECPVCECKSVSFDPQSPLCSRCSECATDLDRCAATLVLLPISTEGAIRRCGACHAAFLDLSVTSKPLGLEWTWFGQQGGAVFACQFCGMALHLL